MEILSQINDYIIYGYLGMTAVLLIILIVMVLHLKKLNQAIAHIAKTSSDIEKSLEDASIKMEVSTKAIGNTFGTLAKALSAYTMIKYLMKYDNRQRDKENREYEKYKAAARRVIG